MKKTPRYICLGIELVYHVSTQVLSNRSYVNSQFIETIYFYIVVRVKMTCLNMNMIFVVCSFKWCCKGSILPPMLAPSVFPQVNLVKQLNARMLMKNSELLLGGGAGSDLI